MRRPLGPLVVGALVLLGASGCATDGGTAAAVEGVSIERTTTTIPPAPKLSTTTLAPVELLPPTRATRETAPPQHDWEGQQYDFGIVRSVRQMGGRWVLTFDREQIHDDHGVRDGPTLSTEPIIIGDDPDVTITNQNRKLRTFGVRDDAEVLRLDQAWTCAAGVPNWSHLTVPELAVAGTGQDTQDSLTFDAQGQVIRIRLSRGC